MGFNLNKAKAAKEEILKSFTPPELNEGNVEAIFNRCLATKESKSTIYGDLFPTLLGYIGGRVYKFDKKVIMENRKNIQYLLGQLAAVHEGKKSSTKGGFSYQYTGVQWTSDENLVLKLLYLGCCDGINYILPFSKKLNDEAIISASVNPTLSPKDPAFPAWWEAHKAEWED